MTNKLPHFKGMTDEDEAVLRGAIVRMNAYDVERFNEYERRIADLERHNELLRAVAEASKPVCDFSMQLIHEWLEPKIAKLNEALVASIDGGAMEVE